jgi:hypothetical protein
VLGIGGGLGGGFAGAQLAPKLGAKPGVAGAVGAAIGAGVGAGLGWLVGWAIGSAAAGSQASTEDCQKITGELGECGKAIEEYKGADPAPMPFEPDGRIVKSLVRGITKPQAAPKGTGTGASSEQAPQAGTGLASIQARELAPMYREAANTDGGAEDASKNPVPARASRAAFDRIDDDDDDAPRYTTIALHSPGRPLDPKTRRLMEPRFNHDFSRVRVHADAEAASAARALAAHAFSFGDHIVFESGRFNPATTDGQRLLAHELTHVVQKDRNGHGSPSLSLSRVSDRSEAEAASASRRVVDGHAVEIEQPPAAALQRSGDDTGKTVGIVLGVLGGLGLASLLIAWGLGAFDSKKKPEEKKPPAKQKLTFEEALKEGAQVLKPEFGLTEGQRSGPDLGDGYDASEWKETLSAGGGDVVPVTVLQSTTSSSWTAFDHLVKNIGKDVPSASGGKTKWSFDCFEYVEVLRLYALWRTMEPAEFDKAFPKLEIGFSAPRINAEWQKAFRADAPGQKPYQFSDPHDVLQAGQMQFGVRTKEPVTKTWAELLAEAPVGSQVIWSNFEAGNRCAKDKTLEFCAYANENVTKLGRDSYSAHPFGVTNEAAIRIGIATPVLEYDARHTKEYEHTADEKKKDFVGAYVKKRLTAYMDKNIYISAIRYPTNPAGPAPSPGAK